MPFGRRGWCGKAGRHDPVRELALPGALDLGLLEQERLVVGDSIGAVAVEM
jgi:hypothetical protein